MGPPRSRALPDWENHFTARKYTVDEWESQREVFTKLYFQENLNLPEVRRIMAQDYGFYANKRQFSRKIEKWDLKKYIKKKDAVAMSMIRIRRAKVGKQTRFKFNGLPVPDEKLHRHFGNWVPPMSQNVYSPVATPEYVEYGTPSNYDPQTPSEHWTPRSGDPGTPSEYWTPGSTPGTQSEYWTPGRSSSETPNEYRSGDTARPTTEDSYPHQIPTNPDAISDSIQAAPSLNSNISSPIEDIFGSSYRDSPTSDYDSPTSLDEDIQMNDFGNAQPTESISNDPLSHKSVQTLPNPETTPPQDHPQFTDAPVDSPVPLAQAVCLPLLVGGIHGSIWGLSIEDDIEEARGEALRNAASEGLISDVRLLLNLGTNVSSKNNVGETPLQLAASGGHEEVVGLLLDWGADVSSKDIYQWTSVHEAAYGGHEAVVRLLLDRGAAVSSKNNVGETPLHFAAPGGHEAIVQLLLDRGAHVSLKDSSGGRILLGVVAARGHEAVARLLLDWGVDASKANWKGQTPLHSAASGGHEAVVRLLLDRGVDVSPKDSWSGQTPLHYAASGGHKRVAQLLLDRGADISSQDNKGNTPLRFAVSRGHEAVAQFLLGQSIS